MKKILYLIVISIIVSQACSTRKNNSISRGFHSTTSKYNILYNGNNALNEGIRQLNEEYDDNFWEILPIEPLRIDEDRIELPGQKNESAKNPFDIAEEKAVKAVQKHSIQEDGTEYNKQMDDAYFLLGKARYYSQRFIPALEAFNYIIRYYPKGDLYRDLLIWKSKTQIRLQNEEQALETLEKVLKNPKTDDRIREEAYTAMAMAYTSLDSLDKTIRYLKKAVHTHENPAQYARNLFILGQLYRQKNLLDSSNTMFEKILKYKKSPQKYHIHAYMELAKNANDSTPHEELKKKIATLIKHYENKKYLGELYYHAALLDFLDQNEKTALEKLKKSTGAPEVQAYQKSKSYELLGNYYFNHSQYVRAGSYYDSLLAVAPDKKSKRIRKLKRKRKSLDEIIEYETLLHANDSIFRLVAMDSMQRAAYFTKYIDSLKKADKIAAIKK